MLSKEFCKEFNGKEITWSFLWALDHKFNAVVLASPEKGVSVKPYWENDEEKEKFTDLWLSRANYPLIKETVYKLMEEPTFCFFSFGKACFENEDLLRQILTDGNLTSDVEYSPNGKLPVCKFA